MSEIVLALCTVPAEFDAGPLAHELVDLGVAACVSVLPGVRSVYKWEGVIETAQEQQLVIKTTRRQVDALWSALKSRHPYDVPEFIVVPVTEGNQEYLDWVRNTVNSESGQKAKDRSQR
jgi:periplasmic divalent cation tolerance protein